ncbi:hemerythrin domain-containing protein [Thiohalorhabdus methylotrophus]|uniref:Hemerythrin domain-containing protein n=1 Tax=Thiohalorhabdus methylotrophus TaxID=3242694 RepID=A0ABV4TX77_9GAMM
MECGTETITAFFQDDHRRLDGLFEAYQDARALGIPEPLDRFDAFAEGLRRHIGWEEERLFPVFEAHMGMQMAGPTAVMRREHREIEAVLDEIRRALADGWVGNLAEPEERLRELLSSHNGKEEQVLYPAIDNLLDPSECAGLLAAIRTEA